MVLVWWLVLLECCSIVTSDNFPSLLTTNASLEFTAILSIASCLDTWRLFRIAEADKLLHIAISESDCPRLPPDQAITIPLITKGQELPQLLLDFRTRGIYDRKSAVIIYDDTVDRDTTTRIVKSFTQRSSHDSTATAVSFIKLPSKLSRTDLKAILSTIHPEIVGENFLAIVSYGLVGTMMEYAHLYGLSNTKTQWLYLISDTSHTFHSIDSFKNLLREGHNVAFIYNTTMNSEECVYGRKCHVEEILTGFGKALSDAVKDEYDIAAQVSDEEWEAIRPTKVERRDFLLTSIKKHLTKLGTCDNCTFWRVETAQTWGMEYQNLGQINTAELLSVGTWRPSDGPSMSDELFVHIAHGFRGKLLPMVSFHNPPWQRLVFNESGDVVKFSGLVFDIIELLSKNLNFTYKVEIVDSTVYAHTAENYSKEMGSMLTNEIPDVLVNMVKGKSIALGACAVTVTDKYKQVINYTIPISIQTYTMLVTRPRELSRALLFISPFTGDTWFCLSAAIVAMGPILYCMHRYSPVYEYKGIRQKGGLMSVQNCIWYMYGALLQQGGMHLPYADSARILVGSWWLVVLVVATTYCGNLVAFLTFPKIEIPIKNLDDLISHRETVSWSFQEGSYLDNQMRTTSEPRYRLIYERRKKQQALESVLKEIEEGKHVLIDWKMRLQFVMKERFIETDRCDFVLALDEFYDEQLAMIAAQDSPYLKIINDEIKRLHQVGLIEKWLKDKLPSKNRCWKNRHIVDVNIHTVNMDDVQGSLYVLLLGFVIALVMLIFEKIWSRYFGKHRKKIIHPFAS